MLFHTVRNYKTKLLAVALNTAIYTEEEARSWFQLLPVNDYYLTVNEELISD